MDVETEDGRIVGRVSVRVEVQGDVQPSAQDCFVLMKRISGLKLLEERRRGRAISPKGRSRHVPYETFSE